ncbi:MAG: IS30 family transposase [Eubacterium sp.]|nr:IS30 family transposase [Eubacterium sp.]
MNKKNHDQKHLTLSDRIYIEQEILQGSTFRSIANVLHKDPSTISKEIRLHATVARASMYKSPRCKLCKHFDTCAMTAHCRMFTCNNNCWNCNFNHYAMECKDYDPFRCPKLSKPPYVCNNCETRFKCHECKRYYYAAKAQEVYKRTLSDSREGINLTPEELQELNDLISPLVLKGQPLSHIFAVHADEIPVCRRTLYNYFDKKVFKARNIDLPRRVRYKKRKKRYTPREKNYQQTYRNKRTYIDFERFMTAHPDVDVVEMDTVKGTRDSGKCLLTLLFRSCSFMIVILLPNCTQRSVINAINNLCDTIGIKTFKKYFPVILTDNGSEFKNPWAIEQNEAGTHRTYVFYCDPYVSNQKARLEKNHEYIRYIIPKGRSMYKYTQEDISLMASHINSTARDSLNGVCPFDLAELLLDKKIPLLTGQHKVSPDHVVLKPVLIEHRDR